jgi:hypothetical protein
MTYTCTTTARCFSSRTFVFVGVVYVVILADIHCGVGDVGCVGSSDDAKWHGGCGAEEGAHLVMGWHCIYNIVLMVVLVFDGGDGPNDDYVNTTTIDNYLLLIPECVVGGKIMQDHNALHSSHHSVVVDFGDDRVSEKAFLATIVVLPVVIAHLIEKSDSASSAHNRLR